MKKSAEARNKDFPTMEVARSYPTTREITQKNHEID